ncbi:LPS export ABC transporter periplasmic protein LptC [candidate division KSB3 bacterium]|uniref:LPS export ABC transporter periplasmic protein LptC n=1 Tax=candidate division KSB3 bacterium TaxID=2044937 RepID=A0A9D5Q796_9BACT|nr:LPS export ABC transporter periplasmic protein LptC [candidate division KSB3 bacterium]MBD3326640.1 LPS export ABC transporter periplasmic protein LptC [candidate division KSB3 bacterium]
MVDVEKIKRGLLVTIACMAAMMAYYIWSYNQQKTPVKPTVTTIKSGADVVVSNVELVEFSENRELWRLQATVAEVYNATKETRLEDVDVDFFDQTGQVSMHLTSDYAVKDDKTGNIIATGNVEATTFKDEATLKTSELVYDAGTNRITSDKPVIIERGNMITTGEGLESDTSLSWAKILRNVTTTLRVGEE